MDPSLVKIPPLRDLTIDNITENVILINSLCQDARMKYVLERLVTHLHDFARETRLSFEEWMAGIRFLTETGQICTDVRQVRKILALALIKRRERILTDSILPGIHSPLRRPRPLATGRLNRPPQTPQLDRRHCPRPLPHARSTANVARRLHVPRRRRRTPTSCLQHQRPHRPSDPRRKNRYLGNRFHGPL